MAKLKIYQNAQIEKLLSRRPGETKFGEKVSFTKTLEDLPQNKATYVLFGIPEDVGVRANHGNPGTSKAWSSFLPAFLNIQSNEFNRPEDLLLLGEVDCSEEMLKASHLEESDPNYLLKLGELVSRIDEAVSAVVKEIVSAGKIPIIIGGGHNNAYGNLKGASEALGSAVSVLNIDAHTDLRLLEQRHSGNGFSYARKNGYLKRYAVFGLQQNYTPQFIFEEMRSTEEIKFTLMEELSASNKPREFQQALEFVDTEKFGFEVDCDVIAGFPSSAVSPSGFSLDEVRSFVRSASSNRNCIYFHLCEAATNNSFPTGKALSYLVTDFISSPH